ncbi:glycoside hydrolase family 13 protein [Actinocorallia sp. API 0066]|uniref:glycoside hydrolase family 13 protein n=1 Tax=Actinocorallia sp. API 0066 TaxID=2896846 RepID=UPI001E5FC4E8|nr:glycoside hydrolase family 13 protein [Actinocorallia sp. API 0066]MCD0452793.1 glycoside hydrolase family 13 protein [Actinocorallia sp. API 0066]
MTTTTPWWRDAVVYQVYPRSFADSNGDGEGDLQGLRSRLPYLADLGVDALWLTPFYTSPLADGGYDVADYRDVDPRFGTLADFDALVADAHRLGLRLIVDIVPNHTSSAHPWFQEALAGYGRERYLFREGDAPPNDWQSNFGGPAWTRVEDGSWYLHLYTPAQPDLNWRHPEVRKEFEHILRFWLDRGVDGFRIDVAAGLFKHPGLADLGEGGTHAVGSPMYGRPEVHQIYRDWRAILDSYPDERMAVGEVWTESPDDLALYVRPDELHQAFQFHLLLAPWSARAFRETVETCLASPSGKAPTWVLSNHDVIRHSSRYGPAERSRSALMFILALPGSAYLYQGEELGLPEVFDLPDAARQDPIFFQGKGKGRDGCRVPLPWSGTAAPYGFGAGEPWLPQPDSWAPLTVQAQSADPESMLAFYRRALALRRRLRGTLPVDVEWLETSSPDVLSFRRGPLTCTVNFGDEPVPFDGAVLLAAGDVAAGKIQGGGAVWLTV